jgi:hypothetical protein
VENQELWVEGQEVKEIAKQSSPSGQKLASSQATKALGDQDGFDLLRYVLMLALALVLIVPLGVLISRVLLREEALIKEAPRQIEKQERLIGAYLQNGAVYLGNLVFEDEKTILLRDVYIPLGFFPSEEEGSLAFRVAKYNESNPYAPNEKALQKEEVMFRSEVLNEKVLDAINRYLAPGPTPTPT